MSVEDILGGVTVEVGFGVDAVGGSYFVLDDAARGVLDNVTYLLAPATVFVDVTSYVRSVDIDRGRERELDEYSTGTATVVLNDTNRTFDPSYSGSPYAGQITPMRRIQIKWEGVSLFQGWIEDWSVMYEPGNTMSRVTAQCVDGFAILANQELDTIVAAYSGDLTGARISRVLDRDEVDFPPTRAIDAGNTVLGATTLGDNALAYLQACARAEAGYLFIAADGTLTFRGRTATLNGSASTVLSDDKSATATPYRTLTQRSSADLLYTRVTGQSETTSVVKTATNLTAAANFGIRTLPLGTLLTLADVDVQSLVDAKLQRFSSVEQRFQSAEIATATLDSSAVQTIVDLDLTDIVTVQRSPLGVGAAVSKLSLIDGIKHRIAAHGTWVTELAFSNADTRSFLTLDDATFGVLDSNRLAF